MFTRTRYNATNSSNDCVRMVRHRVTTPRQDRYILRQHMDNRFTRSNQTALQTTGNHQRPISDDNVRRRLIANNISYLRVYSWALRLYHPEALLYSLRRSRRLYSCTAGNMGFVPTGHRPIKSRHFYQAGDNINCRRLARGLATFSLSLLKTSAVDYATSKLVSFSIGWISSSRMKVGIAFSLQIALSKGSKM
jgi:hypothetical protein